MLTQTLTTALTLLTFKMVTVSGNPNPTTKYRCEFDNLNCIFARQNVVVYARMLTYNDEEPWPQNLGAVAFAN